MTDRSLMSIIPQYSLLMIECSVSGLQFLAWLVSFPRFGKSIVLFPPIV
jgi:hypothetical protein